ncbi:MAG: GNAT family N-acetyltransferase [Oscillospiraceae bacterium]|nr:GNAT family N-acetyltransferase [Oscillospiraceae bacterium]
MRFSDTSLLSSDALMLVLTRFTDAVTDAPPERQKVPSYHFDICTRTGERLGECTLRVGYIRRIYYGGHIGYGIDEPHRGHRYAEQACRILFRLAAAHGMEYVYITCDPENLSSRRTCERLGGELLEIAELPENNDIREHGLERVCVFRFDLRHEVL